MTTSNDDESSPTTTPDRLKWLKTLFPAHGFGWVVVGPIIGGVVLAVLGVIGYFLLDPVQDAADFLSDVLSSEVKVWHVLAALGVAGIVGTVLIAVVMPRKQGDPSTPEAEVTVWSFCPSEIARFGVLWPITMVHDGSRPKRFKAGQPMCPKCHTPLSMKVGEHVIPLVDDQWENVAADSMVFECPADGSQYDLREHDWNMSGLTAIVNNLAMGEYRDAQTAARAEK